MFINAARPQVVWGDGQHYQQKQKQKQQGNLGTSAFEPRLRQRAIAKKLLRNCNRNRFNQLTPEDIRAWSADVLSQSQLTQHFHRHQYPQDADQVQNHQHQQALLQHPVAVPAPRPRPRPWPTTKMEWREMDSRSSQSDDSFLPEDFCSGMSGIGLETPNNTTGLQTAAAGYVSAPPSHHQLNNGFNKGLENGWPAPPMAAIYHSHIEAFDGQHPFSPVFDHGYHHPGFVVDGLPGAWDQTIPLFAEHVDYSSSSSNNNSHGVSPVTSFGSSFSSAVSVSDMFPDNSYTMNIDPIPLATHQHATSQLSNTTTFSNRHSANAMTGEQTTVSPKALRINPSPVPPPDSSTESESFRDNGDWGSSSLELLQHQKPRTHQPHVLPSKKAAPKGRKELPDKPKSRHHHQHQPNVPVELPPSSKGESSSAKAPSPPEPVVDSLVEQTATNPHPSSEPAAQLCPVSSSTKRNPPPATAETKLSDRSKKDEFLVKSKLAGMPYKEIRRKGGFTEAESTLRGRFRTLTKKKEERVRKPEWSDDDVRLLKKAVRKLAKGNDPASLKVPWKQVAEYIADKGGYHFGNATCRKRWDELVEQGKVGFK